MTTDVIETGRVLLRPWTEADADSLYRYASSPNVAYWSGWKAHESVSESLRVIRNLYIPDGTLAICLSPSGTPVGAVTAARMSPPGEDPVDGDFVLDAWLGMPFWNRGYMTEVTKAVVRRCFLKLGAARVWASFREGNARSRRVLEKCGFRFGRIVRNRYDPVFDNFFDSFLYTITRDEWQAGEG